MDDELIDALENELAFFISDDGNHRVSWVDWYDEKNDATYSTWVCLTHHKLYYVDCIFSAQV